MTRSTPISCGILDRKLSQRLIHEKVLVVGSGGIGCELLKNLVLVGFQNIFIIDLDTIDVSNLNRQFLFQKKHVGLPKSEVAKQTVLSYNPSVNITAIHDDIKRSCYDIEYFQQFSLVFGALDNLSARNHVNRMCLAANVPLIESGTAGYLGQVTVIKKSVSECFECHPKPPVKQYPVCTIRNTPSQPIHCIVWAKYLFNQLWGKPDDDNNVSPDTEASQEKAANHSSPISLANLWKQNHFNVDFLIRKLFDEDIRLLLSMENLWENRKRPQCLDFSSVSMKGPSKKDPISNNFDQSIWSLQDCCAIFFQSVSNLLRVHQESISKLGEEEGYLVWDKDDDEAMNFVAAASNIRAHNFHIPLSSRFDIKSMAGNIIPAIATTNAIISGLIVIEGMKVLNDSLEKCRNTYLSKQPNASKLLLITESLMHPNPKCYVCSSKPEITVRLNCSLMNVHTFIEKVLKGHLTMSLPDVMDGSRIIISSEEGETDCNLRKSLEEVGVKNGSILNAEDFSQNYQVIIFIVHSAEFEDGSTFDASTDFEIPKNDTDSSNQRQDPMPLSSSSEMQPVSVDCSDDLVVCIDDFPQDSTSVPQKRSLDLISSPSKTVKRSKNLGSSQIVL